MSCARITYRVYFEDTPNSTHITHAWLSEKVLPKYEKNENKTLLYESEKVHN